MRLPATREGALRRGSRAIKRGWKGFTEYRDKGEPDTGWDYNPADSQDDRLDKIIKERQASCNLGPHTFGKKDRGGGIFNANCSPTATKMLDNMLQRPDPRAPMPPPRTTNIALLGNVTAEKWKDHFNRFMSAVGLDGENSGLIEAPTGHNLYVSIEIFTDHKTKKLKIDKEGRDKYLLFLADAIKNPAEIWLQEGEHKDQTLMFLSRYIIAGDVTALIAAFKQEGKVWTGWSGFQSTSSVYLDSKRTGNLLWRKP